MGLLRLSGLGLVRMLTADLHELIQRKEFPDERQYFSLFAPSGDKFLDQEGTNWDFKREWPHSYSDSYYEGIARAICAFANTQGGYLIFGVHDEQRTGGHNKVHVNVDRLTQALNGTLGVCPKFQVRRYTSPTLGDTLCLLVAARDQGVSPYRFVKASSYPTNDMWVRQGHEIVAAEPRHIPLLYCRAFEEEDQPQAVAGSLPPNPRTLKKFVGRLEAFDRLFQWFFSTNEPRLFLWGKGGSGKTSIAYEFAVCLKRQVDRPNKSYGRCRGGLSDPFEKAALARHRNAIGGCTSELVRRTTVVQQRPTKLANNE